MSIELKWLKAHGISDINKTAIILGALNKLESGQYIGSSEYEAEFRLAHEISQFKHNTVSV